MNLYTLNKQILLSHYTSKAAVYVAACPSVEAQRRYIFQNAVAFVFVWLLLWAPFLTGSVG